MQLARKALLRLTQEAARGTKETSALSDGLPVLVYPSLQPNIARMEVNKATGSAIVEADLTGLASNELNAQTILFGSDPTGASPNTYADVIFKGAGYSSTTTLARLKVDADAAFVVGETINFAPSSATAVIQHSKTYYVDNAGTPEYYIYVSAVTGTPTDSDTATGATSSASAGVDSYTASKGVLYEAQSTPDSQLGFTIEVANDATLHTAIGGMWNVTFDANAKEIVTPTLTGMGVYQDPDTNAYGFGSFEEPSLAPRLCNARAFYGTDTSMAVTNLSVDLGSNAIMLPNANATNGECQDYAQVSSFAPTFTINKRANSTTEIAQIAEWRDGDSDTTAQFQLGQALTNGFIFNFGGCQITDDPQSETDGILYRGLTLAARDGLKIIVTE